MFQKFILILVSLTLVQCGTKQTFEQNLSQRNCEAALDDVPENQAGYKLLSKTRELSGTVLSYAAIGSAYTVQLLWDFTATVGAVVILCSPTIVLGFAAISSSSSNYGPLQPICFPGDIKKVQAPMLGKNTAKNTENWNCPDVDGISQSIRKVARCYSDRGTEESVKKAAASLQSVQNSGSFFRCLSTTERSAFLTDLKNIETLTTVR